MRTLGELDELRSSEKSNNFTLLRLIGASLVIYGHAPAIAAASPTYTDFFGGYLHFDYSGDIGLYMFFLISGFLVTKSSRQTGSVPIFLWHRLLRIMPAFIVCVLLCTFLLGGFVTTMPFGKYVIDPSTRVFLWNVSLIDKFAAYLPGVMFTRRYYGMTVDGSLWSLFVEVRLYLMIAILGGLGVFRSNLVANLVFLSIVGLGVGFPGHLPMIACSRDAMMVSALFLFGGAIHINRKHIFIDYYVLVLLAIACYLSRSDSLCYHLLFLFPCHMPCLSWHMDQRYPYPASSRTTPMEPIFMVGQCRRSWRISSRGWAPWR
jgi:peptidoglycan/LPS O-acetylase OafA/YrhL